MASKRRKLGPRALNSTVFRLRRWLDLFIFKFAFCTLDTGAAAAPATGPRDSSTRTRAALRAARTAPARPAPPLVAAPPTPDTTDERRRTTTTKRCCVPAHMGTKHKAGDAPIDDGVWGKAALGHRLGIGELALFLQSERGSHRHTAVVTRPRLSLLRRFRTALSLLLLRKARCQQ